MQLSSVHAARKSNNSHSTSMVSSIGVDGMSSSIAISLTYGYTDGSTSNVRSP